MTHQRRDESVRSVNRREILEYGAKLAAASSGAIALGSRFLDTGMAQDSTPDAFPPADLPVLEITFAADGSVTAPAESPAGTTVVRYIADGTPYVSTTLITRPAGISDADFDAGLASDDLPEWVLQSRVTASADWDPAAMGNTQEIVTNLSAGTWYAVTFGETVKYASFEVTGDAVIVELDANVSVVLVPHDFSMPEDVPAGAQVWRTTNADDVLHHMVLFATQSLLSDEEVLAIMEAMESEDAASPEAAEGPPPMIFSGGVGVLSKGEVVYQEISLDPGTYTAVCFVSDPGETVPHFVMGMIASFTAV